VYGVAETACAGICARARDDLCRIGASAGDFSSCGQPDRETLRVVSLRSCERPLDHMRNKR